jgi:hypothetical protein
VILYNQISARQGPHKRRLPTPLFVEVRRWAYSSGDDVREPIIDSSVPVSFVYCNAKETTTQNFLKKTFFSILPLHTRLPHTVNKGEAHSVPFLCLYILLFACASCVVVASIEHVSFLLHSSSSPLHASLSDFFVKARLLFYGLVFLNVRTSVDM